MRRLVAIVFAVLVMLVAAGVGVEAAPQNDPADVVGPYEGMFRGTAYADEGESAPLWLFLTHRGNRVAGIVYVGEGLQVDGGFCGTVDVPATAQYVEAQTASADSHELQMSPTFDVGGLQIGVDFESTLSTDGERISAQARVDLPWFCGRDPTFTGSLVRE